MATIIQNSHYSIYLDNSLQPLALFIDQYKTEFGKYFILVDENTHANCVPYLLAQVKSLQEAEILEIDAGEKNKNIRTATGLWESLLENGADRDTLIINLGGGLVCDMGGFVASVFKRGISFINVPTTLLAITDASIGSKTGIDLSFAKNQIGTFAHPKAVFMSTKFLKSLPDRELLSGMGEVIKYALIADPKLWEVIKNQDLNAEMDFDIFVHECVKIKNDIVVQDLFDRGERKILNFGHTIGHALESLSLRKGKRSLLHGEAVALGMIVELFLSAQLAGFDGLDQHSIQQYILDNFDLFPIDESDFDELLDLMHQDKKNSDSEISFVLLKAIGQPIYNQNVSEEDIVIALKYYASL